ncbi:MAG: membrane dipeptidase [Tissierellia bacterium]|jgi:membrane dipeptidase|nr:membrane dipeptidase [Tissierellia bacterium]
MNIFDGHSDIWTDVTIKNLNGENDILRKYHLNKLKEGHITGGIFVIWIDPPNTDDPYKRTIQIFNSIRNEIEYCKDSVLLAKSYSDIEKALNENKFYIFIGLEGLSSIGENLEIIDYYYDFGARHASLTWNEENALATGVKGNPHRGLSELGKRAVKKINDKNMLLDVSHLNDKSFWDVIEATDKPVIASHSNSRELCDNPRNLTDRQLKAIAMTNGLVGLNSFNEFVHKDIDKQNVKMLAKHAVHMADLVGVDHIGLGMDYLEFLDNSSTNSFSSQETSYTIGLEDASKTCNLIRELENEGFSNNEIEKIGHGNFYRVIKDVIK